MKTGAWREEKGGKIGQHPLGIRWLYNVIPLQLKLSRNVMHNTKRFKDKICWGFFFFQESMQSYWKLTQAKVFYFPILLCLKCGICLTACTYRKKNELLSNCSKEIWNNIVLPEKGKNCTSFIRDQKQGEIFEAFIPPLRLLSHTQFWRVCGIPNLRTDYDGARSPEIERLSSILKKAIVLFARM